MKDNFNYRLQQLYGNHVETELPLFRVVFSDDEVERREGEFWYSEGGILYSTPVREIRTVPKYDFLDGQWVLEILTFVPHNAEIKSGYTYEVLWAWDKGLPLNWNAIEKVVYVYLNKVKSPKVPKTQKEADYQESERIKRAKAIVKNRLDNTALVSALHDGDAISFHGVDARPSKQKG